MSASPKANIQLALAEVCFRRLTVPPQMLTAADGSIEPTSLMSASGTKRTSKCCRRMSAIGGKADMGTVNCGPS